MSQLSIAVLGGSFAAVEAACAAAQAGHRVTLIHPAASLGGDVTASHHAWIQNGGTGEPLPLPVGAVKKALYAKAAEAGVQVVLLSHAAGIALAGDQVCGILTAHPYGLSYCAADVLIDASAEGAAAMHLSGPEAPRAAVAEYTFDAENIACAPVRTLSLPPEMGLLEDRVFLHDTLRERTMGITFRFPVGPISGPQARSALEREAHARAAAIAAHLRANVPHMEELVVCQLATQTRLLTDASDRPLPANALRVFPQLPPDFSTRDLDRLLAETRTRVEGFLAKARPALASRQTLLSQGKPLQGIMVEETTPPDLPEGFLPCALDPSAQDFPTLRAKAVVAGAGAGGAMAAWALAEARVDTLVLEQSHFCGGTNTIGLVVGAWHGYTKGAWALRVERVRQLQEKTPVNLRIGMMLLWDQALDQPSVCFLGGSTICGVVRDGRRIQGALAYGPDGFFLALGDRVIDGTAEASLLAFAGASFDIGGERDGFVQSTSMWGVDPRRFDHFHKNHYAMDIDVVRPGDYRDLLRAIGLGYRANSDYLISDLYTVREGRRIHGDASLRMADIARRACPEDTVAVALCTHDTHGRPNSLLNTLSLYGRDMSETREVDIRIRLSLGVFLPAGYDGVAVVGKGLSGEREAVSLCRMNPDISNAGYAVGLCVAESLAQDVPLRALQLDGVQRALAGLDILPEWTFGPENALTLELASGALDAADDNGGFPAMMLEPGKVLPMLRDALAQDDPRRRNAAVALAWLGQAEAAPVLVDLLEKAQADDVRCFEPAPDNNLRAVTYAGASKVVTEGNLYGNVSIKADDPDISYGRINQWLGLLGLCAQPQVGLDIALEYAKRAHAGGTIVPGKTAYSHSRVDTHRLPLHGRLWSLCYALERMADPRAVPELERLLNLPELVFPVCTEAFAPVPPFQCTYLEIALARALARCGGRMGVRRLIAYLADVRAVFAEMARRALVERLETDCGRDPRAWEAALAAHSELPPLPYRGSPYA